MKALSLLENVEYHEQNPYAQPIHIDKDERILRFALKRGQSIREHNALHSPFYVFVLEGAGIFVGGDGREQELGAGALVIFDPGEKHSIRAVDERLLFLGFLRGAPGDASDRVGGEMARRQKQF